VAENEKAAQEGQLKLGGETGCLAARWVAADRSVAKRNRWQDSTRVAKQ
jgi:hypothetical protein